MRKKHLLLMILIFTFFLVSPTHAHTKWSKSFVHGIKILLDGHEYYVLGAPDGSNGEMDIPGHEWVQVSKHTIIGKHYNTGPFGSPSFWSSDAEDGELLWTMIGKIDTWSEIKAVKYYTEGYIHHQPLVSVETGERHKKLVLWLRHSAVRDFTFDGSPFVTPYAVTIGADYKMAPNWNIPYDPNAM